jgi:hypothetical protein
MSIVEHIMSIKKRVEWTAGAAAAAAGLATVSYGALAAASWMRFGHPTAPAIDETDTLLDVFMPSYDVVERHNINVGAPADMTFAALMEMSLDDSPLVRAIFRARELVLRAEVRPKPAARSVVEVTKALGWVVLADMPGHEIVMGAVTRPWDADVVFRGIPSEQFRAFDEPGYVKIVWTLRADAIGQRSSVARSETRAIATDRSARCKFRWYWARFSPGIALIRELSMRLVKKDAERRLQPAAVS